MPRKLKCPCGAVLALPDNLTSPAVLCPKCKRKLAVPPAPAAPVAPAEAATKTEPNWFVARDKKKQGPFAFAQLRQLAEKGMIRATDMVLCEGQGKWTPASQVPGLIPAPAAMEPEEEPVPHHRKRIHRAVEKNGLASPVLLAAAGGVIVVLLAVVGYLLLSRGGPPTAPTSVAQQKTKPDQTPEDITKDPDTKEPDTKEPATKEPPPPLEPVKLGEPKTIQLPAQAVDAVIGGGGRYLVAYLQQLRKLAIIDVTEQKIARYIPLEAENVKFAAGLEKVVVGYQDKKILERWDLAKGEKEQTAPFAGDSFNHVVMGAASQGPVLVGGGGFGLGWFELIDLATLKMSTIKYSRDRRPGQQPGMCPNCRVRASADGRVFASWNVGTTPSMLDLLMVLGKEAKTRNTYANVGHTVPGPDGKYIYTAGGRFNHQANGVGAKTIHSYVLPAQQGNLFFCLGEAKGKWSLTLYLEGNDEQPLAVFDSLPVHKGINGWDRDNFTTDRRCFLLPNYGLFVTIPQEDQVVLSPFDLDTVLAKAGRDVLVVTSQPPATVERGQTLSHRLAAKSTKGGVSYRLDSGPKGMQVSKDGKLTWQVSKEFPDVQAEVIVTASDAAGKEVLHAFRVTIPGEPPAAVVVNPPDKKGPDTSGWKEYAHAEGGFTARFPAEPKMMSKKGKDGLLGSAEGEAPGGIMLEVQFSDFDPSVTAAGPKFFLDLMLKQMSPKSQKEIKLGDQAGVEIEMEMAGTTVVGRLFMVKQRLYQANVIFVKGPKDPAMVARFLDSFKLKDGSVAATDPPKTDQPKKEIPSKLAWKEYRHTEGNFLAQFPAPPKMTTEKGKDGLIGGAEADFPTGGRLEVKFIDFDKNVLAAGPKLFLNGMANQLKALKSQEREVSGHPGLALVLPIGEEITLMRLYMVNQRLYQLVAVFPQLKVKGLEANRFFDSFQLLEPPPPPKEEKKTETPKPGAAISAAVITKAFADNEAAARKKYGGLAPLLVEGVVKEVFVNKKGEVTVFLRGHNDSMSVLCNTFANEKTIPKMVREGQTIRVRGAGYGLIGSDILLGNCRLMP